MANPISVPEALDHLRLPTDDITYYDTDYVQHRRFYSLWHELVRGITWLI